MAATGTHITIPALTIPLNDIATISLRIYNPADPTEIYFTASFNPVFSGVGSDEQQLAEAFIAFAKSQALIPADDPTTWAGECNPGGEVPDVNNWQILFVAPNRIAVTCEQTVDNIFPNSPGDWRMGMTLLTDQPALPFSDEIADFLNDGGVLNFLCAMYKPIE